MSSREYHYREAESLLKVSEALESDLMMPALLSALTHAVLAGVDLDGGPPPETVQEQDIPRAPRILEQLTDSELAEARRQVIADRLAGIGGTEDDS